MSSDHTPLVVITRRQVREWLRSEVQSPEGKQAVNALAAKSQTLESELEVRQLETRLDPSGSITEKTPSLGGDSITAPPASTNAPVETCDTPSSSNDDTPRHVDMLDKFMEVAFTLYCEADPTQEGEFGWPALMPLLDRLQSITWSRQGGSKLDLLHQLEETFDADHSGTVGFVEFVEMLGQPPLIDLLAHELRSLMPGLLHQALASLGEEAEPHGSVVEENEAVELEPEPEEMITAGDVDNFLAVATNLLFVAQLQPTITHLIFGDYFNQPVEQLPPTIKHLTFGNRFNQPVEQLPPTITHLTFGSQFNQPVEQLRNHVNIIHR